MRYLTIVYKLPDEVDAALLTNHPHTSAFAWSHKMDECRRLIMENEQLKEDRNKSGVELRNAVFRAVAAEREACAKVCEGWDIAMTDRLARFIRERSNE